MNEVTTKLSGSAPFASMPELQREHLELAEATDALERAIEGAGDQDRARLRRETIVLRCNIRRFVRRAVATGTVLDMSPDRALARSMLDFWSIRQAYLRRHSARLHPGDGERAILSPDAARLCDSISLAPFDEESAPELPDFPSPFVGLNAFGEREAKDAIFFGREEAVAELRKLLAERRLAIVTGPSGSGKSSLIMAGLVPALHAGAISGSEGWRYWPPVLPGADPFAALLQSLYSGDGDQATWVAEHRKALEQDPRTLADLLTRLGEGGPSLLVVDQMEEMLSMVADRSLQEKFAAAIVAPSLVAKPDHHVIVVIREDFLPRLMKLEPFASMTDLSVTSFRPKPMTSVELRQAIEAPARAVGLKFEEGIVEDLVREVVNDPAALPLLQFTLTQLWQRRRRNRITREAYAEIGRPAEALGRTAENVFEDLKTEQAQAAARDIFLALVVPAVGAEYVRRRVRREALHALRDSTQIDRVLDAFVAAGLIRKTQGVEAGDDRFDVMHEALLRNWSRLIAWLKEIREKDEHKLLMLNRARIWEQSGREPDHLAVGAAIDETAEFAAADPLVLEYVEASRAHAKALRRRRNLRVGAVVFLVAALVVLGVMTNLFSRWKHSDVLNDVQESTVELQESVARQLARENEELVSSPSAPRKLAVGPGVNGLVRVGLAAQSYLRSVDGEDVVPAADVRAGNFYRLRADVPLVLYPVSGGDPAGQVRLIGSASAGAVVLARSGVTHTDRATGRQYWLPVRVIPRVLLQYSGSSERVVGLISDRLRAGGYDVPPIRRLTGPRGRAEIRYYFEQDAEQARGLANALREALARRVATPPPVSVRHVSGNAKAHQGYLEVWMDLPPDPACAAGQSTAGCEGNGATSGSQGGANTRDRRETPVAPSSPAQSPKPE
ncbi:MAG TPA: ATP-binding protein [Allosphingosinicella sp.]